MSIDAISAIVQSGANVTLNINAADLRSVVNAMVADERKRIEEAIEKNKERATIGRKEAARMLGVSLDTLRRWDIDGYLCPIRVGAKVLYRHCDIDAMLTKKTSA